MQILNIKHSIALATLALSILNPAGYVHAETGYVSDSFYVPLRSGKGNQYRILNGAVKTGTQVEILDEDDEWVHVRMPGGTEGYFPTQYITKQPIAKMQLADARSELTRLAKSQQTLKEKNDQLQTENTQLKQQLNSQGSTLADTTTELDEIKRIAASTVDLNKRHQELLNAHQILQTKIDVLKAENNRYQNDNRQKWFFYGAAAVLLGVIITLIVPMFKRPKRNSEWLN